MMPRGVLDTVRLTSLTEAMVIFIFIFIFYSLLITRYRNLITDKGTGVGRHHTRFETTGCSICDQSNLGDPTLQGKFFNQMARFSKRKPVISFKISIDLPWLYQDNSTQ